MSTETGDPRTPPRLSAKDLAVPDELSGSSLRRRIIVLGAIGIGIVAVITLLPGLQGLRDSLERAEPGWLALGVAFKLLSGLGYVAIFRVAFCRRMTWRGEH